MMDGQATELKAAAGAERAAEFADAALHGTHAQVQPPGDAPVGQTGGQQGE